MSRLLLGVAVVSLLASVAGCDQNDPLRSGAPTADRGGGSRSPTAKETPAPPPEKKAERNRWVTRRPPWLGKRVLPPGPGGFGVIRPTPPILRNRRLATIDLLPPPESRKFKATIGPVPTSVAKRSSWRQKCPVSLEQLSYIMMSFWGFDRSVHTGEMLVNASVGQQVVQVFKQLFRARFPIEEMRVITLPEVQEWRARPTGDTNVTSSFECRQVTLGSTWSQHAYGLAIDINPFHNPYLRGDLVAPELASAYVDRTWRRPGMILEGDAVTEAFDSIGWEWGGRWNTLKDWMHFSQTGN